MLTFLYTYVFDLSEFCDVDVLHWKDIDTYICPSNKNDDDIYVYYDSLYTMKKEKGDIWPNANDKQFSHVINAFKNKGGCDKGLIQAHKVLIYIYSFI